ncbi:MAG: helix-turn-helix transcriptional regulator [Salinivirgaceae bacterium]|nr:helix-turn-helix transcriptional regulator [Salinivirgaceae bacterium]
MGKIHFGNEIRRVMELRGTSAAEVAKALNLHVHSVYDMLKRENIDVYRLMELSELLNYDFLQVARFYPTSAPDWCEINFDDEKIVIVRK